MLRISFIFVVLATGGVTFANHAQAQLSAAESLSFRTAQESESYTNFTQASACELFNLSLCRQWQINPNAGFVIESQPYSGAYASELWPKDFGLFLNRNTASFEPTLNLNASVLNLDPFSISSQLNIWHQYESPALLGKALNPDALTLDLNASYQFSEGALRFTPSGRLMYSQITDQQAQRTDLASDSFEALTLSLNGEVSYAMSQSWGLLMPFASFQWTYQFDTLDTDTGYRWVTDLSGQALGLTSDSAFELNDQDYFNLGVGFSAQFRSGAEGFINYQKLLGHDELDEYRLRAGLRFEF